MSTRVSISLPGLRSPGVGFDEPFAMLEACHDRVRRSLDLLERLCRHLHAQGQADDAARQAARDVLRYFDIAAPLHHEDEERHVFPPLLAEGAAPLQALVRQLQAEHVEMARRWAHARQGLQALADRASPNLSAESETALTHFAALYDAHMRHEEQDIYPASRQQLSAATQQSMGQEMARRRGATAGP